MLTVLQQARSALDRLQGWFRTRLETTHSQLRALTSKPTNLADVSQKLSSAVMEEMRGLLTALQTANKASFARHNAFFNQEYPARYASCDYLHWGYVLCYIIYCPW